jgi:hypothetical protein
MTKFNKQLLLTACALYGFALLWAEPVHAQSLGSVIADMRSEQYVTRRSSFYALLRMANPDYDGGSLRQATAGAKKFSDERPEVQQALIKLLERENAPDATKNGLTEDAYHGDLIATVAALQTPHALNALLGAIQTGALAENGLAALGAVAVPGLTALVRSGQTGWERQAAARTLGRMSSANSTAGVDLPEIRATLLAAMTTDPETRVRATSAKALMRFSTADVREAMQRAATSDTGKSARSGIAVFPVREAAMNWLKTHPD